MTTKYQVKRNETTCYCGAEEYPHRLESTKSCRELYNENTDEDELLQDFERKEAQSYNNELSIFEVRF